MAGTEVPMDTIVPASSAPGIELEQPVGTLVLPGDPAARLTPTTGGNRATVRLGSGVIQRGMSIMSTKAGRLALEVRRSKVAVTSNQRRYAPALEDMVIGVVTERFGDGYRVAINGPDTATLPALEFEGATKRNKPSLHIGAAVFCRVSLAARNLETELSCIEPGSSKSWVGGETLYGELKGGNIIHVSLALARAMLHKDCPILTTLGKRIRFESAVGVNGRVWVKSDSVKNTVLVSAAIARADTITNDSWYRMVSNMLRSTNE